MWLIVGLGNPGLRYKWSRHNIGFHVIDLLSARYKIKIKKDESVHACVGKGIIEKQEVFLVKPFTFMNRSGLAVKRVLELHKITLDKMLVVLDDIDLPWDKVRLRASGGSGGHRGLQSIIDEIGSTGFLRLRMGVGRPGGKNGVVEYVLERFSQEEKSGLKGYCERTKHAVITLLRDGPAIAMNRFN